MKAWLRYLNHKESDYELQKFIYERALKLLPASYKLRKKYLELQKLHLSGKDSGTDGEWLELFVCYERALRFLPRMPRIYLDYAHVLASKGFITRTRQVYDRCLQYVPIMQHERVWKDYLGFVKEHGPVDTLVCVYKRYLKLWPERIEDLVELLVEKKEYNYAALYLVNFINGNTVNGSVLKSYKGKNLFYYWTLLSGIIHDHSDKLTLIDVESVLRSGIKKFTNETGKLWNSLARFYILSGEFERARDIFEEGLQCVMTLRDFTQIFEAYVEFEETILSNLVEDDGGDQMVDDVEVDIRMHRLEQLLERRPFMVNEVLLRQNPHNVQEWLNRIGGYLKKESSTQEEIVAVFEQALVTINPKKASGKFQSVWIEYARYMEELSVAENLASPNLSQARQIFERSFRVAYKHPDNLAECYIACCEMELRHKNEQEAFNILARGTAPPRIHRAVNTIQYLDAEIPVQHRVFKSLKLWNFLVDLEESLGTLERTRAAYDKMIELKVVVPQSIINYALLLQENKYFEESFKVYEKGIELFQYPTSFEIWNLYLKKFVNLYKGTKLERARDLFDEALKGSPAKFVKPLSLLYAKLEEDYGVPKRALQIYIDAAARCLKEEKVELYTIGIAKAVEFFGLPACRPIYEVALESLQDEEARTLGRKYIDLEVKMGEFERARAVFNYVAQFTDPRSKEGETFWSDWHNFEVRNGNEDTFKEMLRVKRAVEAEFSSRVDFLSEQLLKKRQESLMARPSDTFISGGKTQDGKALVESKQVVVEMEDQPPENQNEIKLDFMDEDDDANDGVDIEPQNVVVYEHE